MMKKSTYLVLIILTLFATLMYSQNSIDSVDNAYKTPLKIKYGIFSHYNYNIHTSSFSELNNIPTCCRKNMGGTGTGFSLGALVEYPFNDNWSLHLRLEYSDYNGYLTQQEKTTIELYDEASDDYYPSIGIFEYQLDTKLSTIEFTPLASYKILDNFFLQSGFRIAYLFKRNFHYQEKIVEPKDQGWYHGTNRDKVRNVRDGKLTDASSILASFTLGLSYQLQASPDSSIFLVPEAYYSYLINPIVVNSAWHITSFKAGVTIKYLPPPPPPPPPAPPMEAPLPKYPNMIKPPEIYVNIDARQIDSTNKVQDKINIKLEDFVTHNMSPLLNYIFFDDNSSEIPSRYIKLTENETHSFNVLKLRKLTVLETYYHILNIAGLRLRNNPKTKITLVGTNSYFGAEKGNLKLSRSRAMTVKNYLVNVWGINSNRIKVRARQLPRQPSNYMEPDGQEENRRVELLSSDWKISEPVAVKDTTRNIAKSIIRFFQKSYIPSGIKLWALKIKQEGKIIKQFEGAGKLPLKFDWRLNSSSRNISLQGGHLTYSIMIEDSLNQVVRSKEKQFKVEQLTIEKKRNEKVLDREYEYYSLILFDYGKYRLRGEHRKILQLIKKRLKPNSKVVITGHTDLMGRTELNKRIATQRAKAVAKYLKIPNAKVIGVGEDNLLYDNATPEGRFYCRTVRITIETPISNGK